MTGRVMFGDLARHYIKYELGELAEADDQKSHTTIERYLQILNNRLIPRWGNRPALEVEPLEIMQWLKASKRMENLENPTVDKIRRVMNLVFKHGQTYGLIPRTGEANPMKFVRVKTQSEYEAKIITPEQCFKILMAMPQPERTLTLLIAATGLRISECLGLQWADVDYDSQQVFVRRSWTGGKVGKPKSAASKAPVPLVPLLAGFIRQWQEQTPYGQPTDWVFASTRLKGQAAPRREHAGRRSSPSGCGEGGCAQEKARRSASGSTTCVIAWRASSCGKGRTSRRCKRCSATATSLLRSGFTLTA